MMKTTHQLVITEESMITIDDKTYEKGDLSPEQLVFAERANVINDKIAELNMQLNELNLLVNAYANAIKEGFSEEE